MRLTIRAYGTIVQLMYNLAFLTDTGVDKNGIAVASLALSPGLLSGVNGIIRLVLGRTQ